MSSCTERSGPAGPVEAAGPAGRRTVGAGATLATGSQLATAALGGLMGIVVARLLGPAETGAFNVVLSALVLLTLLATLGLNWGATYYLSNKRWAPGDAFRQVQLGAFALGLLGALVGLVVVVAGRDSIFEGVPGAGLGFLLGSVPFAVSWLCSSYIALGLDRYETYAFASVGANLAALVLVAVLAPTIGLTGAIAGLGVAQALNALYLVGWGLRTLPRPSSGWLRRTAAEISRSVSFGVKAYLTQALQLLNYRADLFILNAVAAKATVGRYAVALAVSELGLMLPRALATVVFPRVAALDTEPGSDEQRMVVVKSVRHSLLLAPVTAAGLAIALLAIPLVYGGDFRQAIEPGFILVPGVVALGVANVLSATVVGKGFPQYALYQALLVTPPTVGLYLLLVPALGANGAALASTASYACTATLTFYFFSRVTGLREPGSLLPGRAELSDYLALASRGRAAIRLRRSRRRA
jgi:O-antigen/teichoic acid export membrane protein